METNPKTARVVIREGLDCIVVMPAYNEQGCIEKVITEWSRALQMQVPGRFVMVVVNDGSKDSTGSLLDKLALTTPELRVIHQVNAGHGAALITGYRAAVQAHPQYVFQTDSDDQFEPDDFAALWARRAESDFILGWRRERHDAAHRLVISHILAWANGLLFGCRIRDANIPFRLIKASYLDTLLPRVPVGMFAPNIALSIMAAWDKRDLLNVPVKHRDRSTGTVSILRWKLVRVCVKSLIQLVKLRMTMSAGARS